MQIAQAAVTGNSEEPRAETPVGAPNLTAKSLESDGNFPKLKEYTNRYEKEYLEALMSLTNGSATKAAKISGLSRARLYVHLKDHGISPSEKKNQQTPPSLAKDERLDSKTLVSNQEQ